VVVRLGFYESAKVAVIMTSACSPNKEFHPPLQGVPLDHSIARRLRADLAGVVRQAA